MTRSLPEAASPVTICSASIRDRRVTSWRGESGGRTTTVGALALQPPGHRTSSNAFNAAVRAAPDSGVATDGVDAEAF